jgi:hypothetical protein
MTETSTSLTTTSVGVFTGIQAFESAQRIAKALSSSALVPKEYQGQSGLANTLVAMEIAHRMNLSPLQVMQNLHVIHGRPSWSSQFIIAMINGCGRFSPLDYKIAGEGDSLRCYAYATELATGKELKGPVVSMAMAKKEGWATKTGSKWQTMPDLMVRYRAAAFWGRLYVPEFLVGMKTQEEVIDVEPSEVESVTISEINKEIKADPSIEVNSNTATPEQEAKGTGDMDDSVW